MGTIRAISTVCPFELLRRATTNRDRVIIYLVSQRLIGYVIDYDLNFNLLLYNVRHIGREQQGEESVRTECSHRLVICLGKLIRVMMRMMNPGFECALINIE